MCSLLAVRYSQPSSPSMLVSKTSPTTMLHLADHGAPRLELGGDGMRRGPACGAPAARFRAERAVRRQQQDDRQSPRHAGTAQARSRGSGDQHRGADGAAGLEVAMRLRDVLQRVGLADLDAHHAAADHREQLARGPLEVGAPRDVVEQRRDA